MQFDCTGFRSLPFHLLIVPKLFRVHTNKVNNINIRYKNVRDILVCYFTAINPFKLIM